MMMMMMMMTMMMTMMMMQECEQTVMQYNRKLDSCGDCEITTELADALLNLLQDTGVQLCLERAAEYRILDYAE